MMTDQTGVPELEGPLRKLGGLFGKDPQERYFILRDYQLFYYTSKPADPQQASTLQKGVMDLRNTRVTENTDSPFAWDLTGGNLRRRYTLLAANDVEKRQWIAKLSNPDFDLNARRPPPQASTLTIGAGIGGTGNVVGTGTGQVTLSHGTGGVSTDTTGLAGFGNEMERALNQASVAASVQQSQPCAQRTTGVECPHTECKYFMKSGFCNMGHTVQCNDVNCPAFMQYVPPGHIHGQPVGDTSTVVATDMAVAGAIDASVVAGDVSADMAMTNDMAEMTM